MSKLAVKEIVSDIQTEDAELPEGWVACRMGDVADVVGGGTPKASDGTNFSGNGHVWITPADLSGFDSIYIEKGRRDLSDKGLKSSSAKLMPAGTVLMSSRAPIGYVAIAANEICTNQGFKSFICHEGIEPEYVYYWLKYMRPVIEGMGSGSTFTEISGSRCKEIPFEFPPFAEQERIVAQVEALLARVNAARERLAKVPAILKRFCQSVLAAACSGQLTAGWRAEDPSEGDLPESWERKPLGDLCNGLQYGSSKKSDKEGDIPVLRMGNIQEGQIDWSDLVYSSDPDEIRKYSLSPNTVLFNRTNSPELVGKTGIYRGERPAIFAGYLIRINHGSDLTPEYLNYCLNAPEFREYCAYVRTDGVSQSNINARKLAAYEIPWCGLDEQQEIVRRVEALFALADRIEQRAKAATEHVESTTQSILTRAFRGELVETEAELARREGREYESAAQLLARIQAEHEKNASTKPKRRTLRRKSTQ